MRQTRHNVERATRAIINLGAISYNVAQIRKKIGKRNLMAVVKADGYGHGAVEVSRVALRSGADCLGVAIPEEGQQLREAGIEAPILVLGLIQPEEAYKVVNSRLAQTVASVELLEALSQEARKTSTKVKVHVKVDTGLGRIGIHPKDAVPFVRKVKSFKNLNLEGLFSSFSTPTDQKYSKQQLQLFDQVIGDLRQAEIPKKHIANSEAVLGIPESYYDMIRVGILIYGLYRSEEVIHSIEVHPAMVFKTKVSAVKTVPPGTPIGYGKTLTTNKESIVATLPVGYADGYRRQLSNRGQVLIRGHRVPVIGRICMDMCMVNASDVKGVQPGDDVILFGREISINEIAARSNTNIDEVLSGIGKRVPRVYIKS